MRTLSLLILVAALGVVGCDNTAPVDSNKPSSGTPSATPTPGTPATPGTPGTPGPGSPGPGTKP
jgi:hypothetical protein